MELRRGIRTALQVRCRLEVRRRNSAPRLKGAIGDVFERQTAGKDGTQSRGSKALGGTQVRGLWAKMAGLLKSR